MSTRVSVLAPAKINLSLRVLGRRDDGYHEIDTLFQAVDLCDEVEVELREEGVELEVNGLDLGPPEENLAYRAAAQLLSDLQPQTGARIRLVKRIPVGAGLGGGSSDAAAVLRGVAELHAGVPRDRLVAVAAQLGSDVPFFLGESPLARGRGRGEVLEPLGPLPPADFVLVSPPVHVSTAAAYAALSGVRADGMPDTDAGPGPLRSWEALGAAAHNDFEPVISAQHPEIGAALSALRNAGAHAALMTGSGSTCFGLFGSRAAAEEAAGSLTRRLRWPCRVVRSLTSLPSPRRVGERGDARAASA